MAIKDYLGYENQRNKRNAGTYAKLMQLALGDDVQILIGHHLTFEVGSDLSTENEIPSADCLMFDHDIMGKVFGVRAQEYMAELAVLPCEQRDLFLADLVARLPASAKERDYA